MREEFSVEAEHPHYLEVRLEDAAHTGNPKLRNVLEAMGGVGQNGIEDVGTDDGVLRLYLSKNPEHLRETLQRAIAWCREQGEF